MSERSVKSKDYIRAQKADLIGLVETKVRSEKAARITRCLGKGCSLSLTLDYISEPFTHHRAHNNIIMTCLFHSIYDYLWAILQNYERSW